MDPATATVAAALALSVAGDAIPRPLAGAVGDPARGREIVASRQVGLCLLCHSAPIPEEQFQGSIGPDLRGTGARLTPGQIRLRIADPARLNAKTVMPSYYKVDGLARVAPAYRGKPILSAQQIEDVVSYLATLK